jgi:peptide deformylase
MPFLSPVTIAPFLLDVHSSVLRMTAAPVEFTQWSPETLQALVREMFRLQHQLDGVGLAAPQVGLSLQLAVIDNREDPPLVLINPTITEYSGETDTLREGCLSLPGYVGPVERSLRVTVQAYDLQQRPYILTAEGYFARIVQHEVDHLNGTLYADRVNDLSDLWVVGPDALAEAAMRQLLQDPNASPDEGYGPGLPGQ